MDLTPGGKSVSDLAQIFDAAKSSPRRPSRRRFTSETSNENVTFLVGSESPDAGKSARAKRLSKSISAVQNSPLIARNIAEVADSNDKFANGLVNIQRNGSDGHESGGRIKTRLRTRFAHQKSNSIDYGSGRGPLVGKKTGSTRDLKQIARKASRRPERSKSLGSIHRLLHLEPKGNHNGLFEESLGKDAATKFAGSLLSLDLDTLRRLRTAGELSLPKFFEIETEIDISTADMDCKGMRKSVSPRGSLKDDHRKRDAANENARPVAMSKIAGFFRALSFNNVSRDNNKGSMPLLLNPEHPMSPDVKRCKSNDLSCIERSNSLMNERDMLVKERDKAIEEWTRAATKWEQLLDEMDTLMSELIQVKYERDEKTAELDEVIEEYEEDLERRNVYLDELKSGYEELREQLAVARKERIDALMQYDELLKQNYHLNKKLETEVEENKKLRGEIIDYQQNLDSLQQQVDICKHDRDHALQLWNSSVEERKKLHHEMAMLIQARDTSLRKAFQQAEQLIRLREDRDRLQRELENLQRQKHLEPGSFHLDNPNRVSPVVSRNDSGYSADAEKLSNTTSDAVDGKSGAEQSVRSTLTLAEVEYEHIAVSLDRLDSKFGIKVDNAVDEPKVMIIHVSAHVSARSNIRKYDRIVSVNGITVKRADKKTVEKLIRDCAGRLTLVLRREKFSDVYNEKFMDVELTIPKCLLQNTKSTRSIGLGLKYKVDIQDVESSPPVFGVENIDAGDSILKVNTQDINKIVEAVLTKFAKKNNGKVTVRVTKAKGSKENQEPPPSPAEREFSFVRSPSSATKSFSDVSQTSNRSDGSSNLSLSSFSSGNTALTNFTDDNGSIFSEYLNPFSPRIMPTFREEGNDEAEDISSLPERLRLFSSGSSLEDELPFLRRNNASRLYSSERLTSRIQPETVSLTPVETLNTGDQSPLRRTCSDAMERKMRRRSLHIPRCATVGANQQANEQHKRRSVRNSWTLPSPKQNRRNDNENGDVNKRRNKLDIGAYATLPRRAKNPSLASDSEVRLNERVLRLQKASQDKIGFNIFGGNKIGIYIKEVDDGSMASFGGLRVGDRILHLNSYDLTRATLDFATRVLHGIDKEVHFRIEVKHEPKYEDLLKQTPHDSVYVRTLRPFEGSKENDLKFGIGEVLHVTNTFINLDKNKSQWQWYAEKVAKTSTESDKGYVPRLDTFLEKDEQYPSGIFSDSEADDPRRSNSNKRTTKLSRSAYDVKKWLLRKPTTGTPSNKKKKIKGQGSYISRGVAFDSPGTSADIDEFFLSSLLSNKLSGV